MSTREGLPQDLNRAMGTITAPLESPHPPGTLAVCMIVRNEEKNVKEAIENFFGFADQVCVIDTGSTDDTRCILTDFYEKFNYDDEKFFWDVLKTPEGETFNFSNARNASINFSKCAWNIWLDADDRVPESEWPKLQKLKKCALDRGMGFQVQNTEEGAAIGATFTQLRMFPNHPEIRFERRIHEQVIYSIARLGLYMEYYDVHILHTGYETEEAKKAKARRNLALYETEPDFENSPILIMSRGDTHFILEEWEKGIQDYLRCWQWPGLRQQNSELFAVLPSRIGTGYQSLGNHLEAIKWFEIGLKLAPQLTEYHYQKAKSLEELTLESYFKVLTCPKMPSSQALHYDKTRIFSFYFLARLYAALRKWDKYREICDAFEKNYPNVKLNGSDWKNLDPN